MGNHGDRAAARETDIQFHTRTQTQNYVYQNMDAMSVKHKRVNKHVFTNEVFLISLVRKQLNACGEDKT